MSKRAYLMPVLLISLSAYYLPTKITGAQNEGSSGSALSTIAASMQPGTFALLNYDGDASGYGKNMLSTGGSSSIMGLPPKLLTIRLRTECTFQVENTT